MAAKKKKKLVKPTSKKLAKPKVNKLKAKKSAAPKTKKPILKVKAPLKAKDKKVTAKATVKIPVKVAKKGKLVEVKKLPKGKQVVAVEIKKAAEEGSSHKKRCRQASCKGEIVSQGYCRLHYIKNWKRIKRKEMILATGQLNRYVEELVAKYPDKYLDIIRQDLSSEKDYAKVISELELESPDEEFLNDEEVENIAGRTPRRQDFGDDEPDTF